MKAINLIDMILDSIVEIKEYSFDTEKLKRLRKELKLNGKELPKIFGKNKQYYYNIISFNRNIGEKEKENFVNFLENLKKQIGENNEN